MHLQCNWLVRVLVAILASASGAAARVAASTYRFSG